MYMYNNVLISGFLVSSCKQGYMCTSILLILCMFKGAIKLLLHVHLQTFITCTSSNFYYMYIFCPSSPASFCIWLVFFCAFYYCTLNWKKIYLVIAEWVHDLVSWTRNVMTTCMLHFCLTCFWPGFMWRVFLSTFHVMCLFCLGCSWSHRRKSPWPHWDCVDHISSLWCKQLSCPHHQWDQMLHCQASFWKWRYWGSFCWPKWPHSRWMASG